MNTSWCSKSKWQEKTGLQQNYLHIRHLPNILPKLHLKILSNILDITHQTTCVWNIWVVTHCNRAVESSCRVWVITVLIHSLWKIGMKMNVAVSNTLCIILKVIVLAFFKASLKRMLWWCRDNQICDTPGLCIQQLRILTYYGCVNQQPTLKARF